MHVAEEPDLTAAAKSAHDSAEAVDGQLVRGVKGLPSVMGSTHVGAELADTAPEVIAAELVHRKGVSGAEAPEFSLVSEVVREVTAGLEREAVDAACDRPVGGVVRVVVEVGNGDAVHARAVPVGDIEQCGVGVVEADIVDVVHHCSVRRFVGEVRDAFSVVHDQKVSADAVRVHVERLVRHAHVIELGKGRSGARHIVAED